MENTNSTDGQLSEDVWAPNDQKLNNVSDQNEDLSETLLMTNDFLENDGLIEKDNFLQESNSVKIVEVNNSNDLSSAILDEPMQNSVNTFSVSGSKALIDNNSDKAIPTLKSSYIKKKLSQTEVYFQIGSFIFAFEMFRLVIILLIKL